MAKRIISTTVRDSEDKSAIIDYKTAIPYQQGKYDPTVTYVRNEISYPIVKYGELYYYLNLVGEHKLPAGETPASNYASAVNKEDATWVLADNFKVLMADIAFAEFAKMGSFVFDKNRMMSSQGSTNNYTDTNFIPNFEVDGETGLMKFGKNIQFGMKDGYAVLEYYDNNGLLLYDLGPSGIGGLDVREERWIEVRKIFLDHGWDDGLTFEMNRDKYKNNVSDGTIYYRYVSKIVAGINQDETNDGLLFTSPNIEAPLISSGIYFPAVFNAGYSPGEYNDERIYPHEMSPYNEPVYATKIIRYIPMEEYINGRVHAKYNVYWNEVVTG